MVTAQTSPILTYIRHLSSVHLAELSDAQLLEQFALRHDEAAFAVLVRRHGPLVLSVCRRVLRDGHLAEDCFQITFLLLARKAASLAQPNALGPWLYGVATRTARKARSQAVRRRLKEAQVAVTEAVRDPEHREWHELRPVLDESVNSLPEKYRVPFVLHHLQGMTVTEVAQRLGCPRGSIATRLARARERLRARLLRRGLALSAGCLLLTRSEVAASASIPSTLALSTARTAALVAGGQASVPCLFPSFVKVFTEGVLKTMRTTKVNAITGCLLAALLAAGAGTFAYRSRAAGPEPVKGQATIPVRPRREEPPRKLPIRFLSLPEARAIALEHSNDSLRVLADVRSQEKGTVLTGLPKDRERIEFERNVNQVLLNVGNAYWNLYGSYWNLYSREQGLRLADETWKRAQAKYKVGRISLAEVARAENQYNLFRTQRLQAIQTVLDNERQLRDMLGIPTERSDRSVSTLFPEQKSAGADSIRLIPSDAPCLLEKQPDWSKALAQTMKNRPELRLARQDIEHTKESSRERHRAELVFQDQELKAERFLGLYYRRMSSAYSQIKAAKAQRREFARQLRERCDEYRDDKEDGNLTLVLEAQRFWADSLATEFQAIATYNNALSGWEYAKGSILDYAHISFADKPPADAEVLRAVDYERKRTGKMVRREDAKSVDLYLRESDEQEDGTEAIFIAAPTLPCLWKTQPPLGAVENLPTIQEPRLEK